MRRGILQSLPNPLAKRLMPLAYALVAMVAFILLLTLASMQVQTALAGLLNGESIWSKAQKQTTVDLLDYASTGRQADYAAFQRNQTTLDAFRTARDMILSGRFEYADVEAELRRGNAMPAAIPNIVFLLHHFAGAPYMRDALRLWKSTDSRIAEMQAIATDLHAGYASGDLSAQYAARQRDRINAINAYIQPRSDAFSLSIAQGAVWIGKVLFVAVLAAALVALAMWLLFARRTLARIRGSEERYRVLFDSAPDAIVMVDEGDGRILDANRTAGDWSGCRPQELLGQPYLDMFAPGLERRGAAGSGTLQNADGSARPVEMQSSKAMWGERIVRQVIVRDVSERMESERERRIAAEALANIAEGVIIADAARQVLSMNTAATQLTGFTADNLSGLRLDATRVMADGGPLPDSVWDEIVATHHWSGEVQSRRRDGSTYAEELSISTIRDPQQRVLHYVAVFNDVSAAKAARNRLEHLAAHDVLTGMVNRAQFQRRCEQAIKRAARERSAAAVLFIDLDAFKFVNDSYSHAVGDRLLKLVGERIQRQLGEDDVAGRIGGDEFTVLLPGLTLREDAAGVATRMLSVLSEPFHVDNYEIVVSASIGIAGYPLDGDDAKTLIANADAAMYVAKNEERNAWRFYVPMMQADVSHRMQLATELRQALLDQEFRLVFQPSVELKSGRIVAVEALLRWQHPQRGEVMPGEFIPVAESIGLIHRIDEWVMHAVCAQIHAWDASDVPRIRVAVNVSARWFGHPGFIDSVRRALRSNEIDPERIVLEVTEGAMLHLGEDTERTMRALKALGIGVAIDDFGTGYASMAYLKLPAVAYLKIDRSFVTGLPDSPNDAAITQAMLAMAASLGLTTIAEGIETEPQHKFLQQAGCSEGQGYLYSYPLPPAALEHMLRPKYQPGTTKLKLVPPVRG